MEAYTEEGVKALVLLNKIEVLPGRRVRVTRHEDAMTAPAIFDYISNKLHHRLRWTTQLVDSGRATTPSSPEHRGNMPPRRGTGGSGPRRTKHTGNHHP